MIVHSSVCPSIGFRPFICLSVRPSIRLSVRTSLTLDNTVRSKAQPIQPLNTPFHTFPRQFQPIFATQQRKKTEHFSAQSPGKKETKDNGVRFEFDPRLVEKEAGSWKRDRIVLGNCTTILVTKQKDTDRQTRTWQAYSMKIKHVILF